MRTGRHLLFPMLAVLVAVGGVAAWAGAPPIGAPKLVVAPDPVVEKIGVLLRDGDDEAALIIDGEAIGRNGALRAQTVSAALDQADLLDCSRRVSDGQVVVPPEAQMFNIQRRVKVTPAGGRAHTGAFWSPKGDAMVFVVPTDSGRSVTQQELPPGATGGPTLGAVSRNELRLYSLSLSGNQWRQIAVDGAHPTWSTEGSVLYYLAGTDLMAFEVSTGAITATGQSAPHRYITGPA